MEWGGGVALSTATYADTQSVDQTSTDTEQAWTEHTGKWQDNKGEHQPFSKIVNGNLEGVFCNSSESSGDQTKVRTSAKYTFYRNASDGHKVGDLVIEPINASGVIKAAPSNLEYAVWRSDTEIKKNVKRIFFKRATIAGNKVGCTLKLNQWNYNMMFNELTAVELIDLRGLTFQTDANSSSQIATWRMFENCYKLKTILFNADNKKQFSDVVNFEYMFAKCPNLSHILAKGPDEVVDYDSLRGCDLSGLSVFDTGNAVSMKAMFEFCRSMIDFKFKDYANFKTNKVKDFSYMFSGLPTTSAQDTLWPGWEPDTFSVTEGKLTNARGSFKLKTLDLSSLDTSSAETMYRMLIGQEGLTELNLSGSFKMSEDTSTDQMLRGVHALQKLTVNKNIRFSNTMQLNEPNDNIYQNYIRPYFDKTNTKTYSGKWIQEGKADTAYTATDFWNTSKISKLKNALADDGSLTFAWQEKGSAVSSTNKQITIVTNEGLFDNNAFVKSLATDNNGKLKASDLPTKTKEGRKITGWYKLGDSTKTPVSLDNTVFKENTTLVALLEAATPGGAGDQGGSGAGTGSGAGEQGGSGSGTGSGSSSGVGGSLGFVPQSADTGAATELTPMYRLYNSWTGEHLFTTDKGEYDTLVSAGWKGEGRISSVAAKEGESVYRLYNPWTHEHHYTSDKDELASCVAAGWKNEGVQFHSVKNGAVAMYSMYNPHETSFYHHYTSDPNEISRMEKDGWIKEGIKWYAAANN